MKIPAQKRKGLLRYPEHLINRYIEPHKDGTYYDLNITRKRKKHSNPMRKYYWGYALPHFAGHLGYEQHELKQLHYWLRATYFSIEGDERGIYRGVPGVFRKSSPLDVKGKAEFIEWFIRLAAHEGCVVEDPGG